MTRAERDMWLEMVMSSSHVTATPKREERYGPSSPPRIPSGRHLDRLARNDQASEA